MYRDERYLPTGRHSLIKLGVLKNYLKSYVMRFSRFFSEYYYIDLLAGPGKNRIEETNDVVDGSPLIALKVKPAFTKCFFVEWNEWFAWLLAERTKQYPNAKVVWGNCNDQISKILRYIPAEAPFFAFVYPWGFQVDWSTVKKLSQKQRAEILYTFHAREVFRCAKTSPEKLTKVYGTEEWKRIAENIEKRKLTASKAREAFKMLFEFRLKGLFEYVMYSLIIRDSKNIPRYHLLFASNDIESAKKMQVIMKSLYHPIRIIK